jgi:hypothetical protein
MTEKEKWEEEARKVFVTDRKAPEESCYWGPFLNGYVAGCLKRQEEIKECWYCKNNFPLQYYSGYGWFHYLPDGGPDIKCTNPEIKQRPNPEDEEAK